MSTTVIESLGVYLPPKIVSTREILKACVNEVMFPIEDFAGIKTRHMAGEDEFSIDLAKRAIEACFMNSRYGARDIDLLICGNISRCDGPHFQCSFEPSTSMKLKKFFDFDNALVFDVTNACTGIFTAITIADTLIKAGFIRRAMVVSGEYVTCVTLTAQKEIREFMDPRLACLTMGDSGTAMILESSTNMKVGFHELEMYTLGQYCSYCFVQETDQEHGGPIMLTDAIRIATVATKQSIAHAQYILNRRQWPPEDIDHIIMHQTSKKSLYNASQEANKVFGQEICHEGNVIYNLAERGNTGTNSHFVAVMDNIINNRIQTGDTVIFCATGSGITIGTALYTFDDLPDRLRQAAIPGSSTTKVQASERTTLPTMPRTLRIRLESIATAPLEGTVRRSSVELARLAAEECLKHSQYDRRDIGLLIHSGVYRDNFLCEPAIASMIVGGLDMNGTIESQEDRKTFAFDIFNSSLGFLNACYIGVQLIRAKKYRRVMVTASEIENNAEVWSDNLRGIRETGSAVLLEESTHIGSGFGNFIFRYFPDYIDACKSYTEQKSGRAVLHYDVSPDIEQYYLECIVVTVRELLAIEGLSIGDIKVIFPPQISSDFISNLCAVLHVPKDMLVDVIPGNMDYFTSSLAYAFKRAYASDIVKKGDIGLIVGVGAGIQVGCALYYF
jgi:3-oxoacyl-[acyl-carrier-protein] synthase III